MKVEGSNSFSVPEKSFAVSPSAQGYVLKYSADGKNFTAYDEAVPANEVLVVNGVAKGMVYKLDGNTDTVFVQY